MRPAASRRVTSTSSEFLAVSGVGITSACKVLIGSGTDRSYKVLKISENIDEIGYPNWEIVLCLLLSWALVFMCHVRGIKSSGKVRGSGSDFAIIPLL